jgi:hypothetical protein
LEKFIYYKKFIFSRFRIYFNIPYQVQRKVRTQFLRDTLINIVAFFKPKNLTGLSEEEIQHVSTLNQLGWSSLGEIFSSDEVEMLKEKLKGFQLTDKFRPELGNFHLDKVPEQSHIANYVIEDWSMFPEILSIANSERLLKIAGSYLGCMPTISNLQIWWTFPGHKEAEQAENFHRDVDDWKFVKLFIYLTDVDENSGPHVYVQKSCKTHRNLPIKRYTDDEVIHYFGEDNILKMLAKKGEGFFEDTFGFHKGLLANTNKRLLLQVQYSIGPIAINKYKPIPSTFNYDPYVNRLYLK